MFLDICEQAYKLTREDWEGEEGDRFYLKNNLYRHGRFTLSIEKNCELEFEEGVHFNINGLLNDYKELRTHSFHLPYQHQVQRKLLEKYNSREVLFTNFVSFVLKKSFGYLIHRYTFDSLWVMYYYYYMYDLFWDGNEFIPIEKPKWGS